DQRRYAHQLSHGHDARDPPAAASRAGRPARGGRPRGPRAQALPAPGLAGADGRAARLGRRGPPQPQRTHRVLAARRPEEAPRKGLTMFVNFPRGRCSKGGKKSRAAVITGSIVAAISILVSTYIQKQVSEGEPPKQFPWIPVGIAVAALIV